MFVDVGMVVREVWWMGGCLFQGTGRCGVWMVNDLCSSASRYIYILYAVRDVFQRQPRGRMKETSACHVNGCGKHEETARSKVKHGAIDQSVFVSVTESVEDKRDRRILVRSVNQQ